MLQLDDLIVNADLMSVLQTLKSELYVKYDLERFKTFKDINSDIQTNCPFHKEGKERKPSFGINKNNGQCHCFTCGWSGTIDEMISILCGKNDFGKFGKEWLIKRFNSVEIEKRPPILIPSRSKHTKPTKYIGEEELDSYRYYHDYMYQRHLTDEIIEKFDIGFDKKTNCLTIPVYDLSGRCVFVARRSVSTKFFNYPAGAQKPVYLAHLFTSGDYKTAVICEGFLDALIFWKYKIPAMALIGLGSDTQYEMLKKLPVRKYILALDPDEAGRRGQERFRKALSEYKVITEYAYTDDRDINELDSEILNLKEIL